MLNENEITVYKMIWVQMTLFRVGTSKPPSIKGALPRHSIKQASVYLQKWFNTSKKVHIL